LGKHSVENLLPVIGWCVDHRYTKAEIEHAITTFTRIEKKLTVSRGVGGSIVLDDTGNSSGNGFFAALNVLSLFAKKNKIVIGGGIIELGSEKNSTYQELMARLNDVSTAYITTDRLFKKYDTNSLVRVFTKEQDIMQYLATFDLNNTIILLEGRQPKKRLESIIMGE
jgi:UDP-N-acetylmuramyl pentapeptide synthase